MINILLDPISFLSHLLIKLISNNVRPPRFNIRIKHHIDFLESPSRSLRVEEEDMECHDETENGKDDICPPLNVVEGWRDEVGQGEVEDPVS